jgi:hypothetical protein
MKSIGNKSKLKTLRYACRHCKKRSNLQLSRSYPTKTKEKDKALEEKDKVIGEQKKVIEDLVKSSEAQANAIDAIKRQLEEMQRRSSEK